MKEKNIMHIFLTVFLTIAVVILASALFLRGCKNKSNTSDDNVSVNTEASREISHTEASMGEISKVTADDVSADISEEISDDIFEDVSETETGDPVEHTHNYSDAWSFNETDHWKKCTCGNKSDTANHSYGNWITTKEATEESEGSKHRTCTVCGYKETVAIPVLSHSHKYSNDWAANATSHWKECSCGNESDMSAHTYGEWEVVTKATCIASGAKKHTCSACGYNETETIPETRHKYISIVTPPTDVDDGYTTHTCENCGKSYTDSYVKATGDFSEGLSYSVNSDGVTCTITGIGTCEDTNLKIPPKIDGYKVTEIKQRAFLDCEQIVSVIIPNSVITIDRYAFDNCINLSAVTIPNSVLAIKSYAFYGCTSLAKLSIGNGVKEIGASAFYECTSLTTIIIPDSVISIGGSAFAECSRLVNITIGENVTSIGTLAFYRCTSLVTVSIPDSVTYLGDWAFGNCNGLTSVTIGKGVTDIRNQMFENCTNLTSIIIPDAVTCIGEEAFRGCEKLTEITIGKGVTKIGMKAFTDCTDLTNVYYRGSEAEWKNIYIDWYNSCLTKATIHYNS
ncbi:MAG: leucine-rich repeat protein [Clostridia bacterium]|nr:leucine-rich repeat protein [Clostridia bacterium]